MSGQRRRAVFPGKKKRRPLHATSANSFVAEIEVIIKAVCIVDSCVKLMRGPCFDNMAACSRALVATVQVGLFCGKTLSAWWRTVSYFFFASITKQKIG